MKKKIDLIFKNTKLILSHWFTIVNEKKQNKKTTTQFSTHFFHKNSKNNYYLFQGATNDTLF